MKLNNFFLMKEKEKHTKLHIDTMKKELKAMEVKATETKTPHINLSHNSDKRSSHSGSKGGFSSAQKMGGSGKGGTVVNGKTVIVKSNYQIAGRQQKSGGRSSKKSIGKHASASLNYMDNHGNEDIKDNDLSNIYNENCDRLTKDELQELRKEMDNNKDFTAFRRIVIDPGQQDNISREEMVQMTIKAMDEYKEKTGATFDYKIAIHTDHVETGGNIHAHVLVTGDSNSIRMNKEQMKTFKTVVGNHTKETLDKKNTLNLNQKITKQINQQITKTQQIQNQQKLSPTQNLAQIAAKQQTVNQTQNSINNNNSVSNTTTKNEDKSLTLDKQIDKLMDGKLDNKHNETHEKDDVSKAIESVKNITNDTGLSR